MITFDIRRKPETNRYVPSPVSRICIERLNRVNGKSQPANQPTTTEGSTPAPWVPAGGTRTGLTAIGMGKRGYAVFLNEHVYGKFEKGQSVTLRHKPIVPGNPPDVWFTVHDIQEVHYMADMDQHEKEPKCIHIKSGVAPTSEWCAPACLRQLTLEERGQIDSLRNKTGAQPITAADEPDTGSEQSSDGGGRKSITTEGTSRPKEGDI